MDISLNDLGIDVTQLEVIPDWIVSFLKRPVSGTYRNPTPAGFGSIIELRVDVDGRRPQERLSGDLYTHFTFCGIPITVFTGSFVVEEVTETSDDASVMLSGPVIYYADLANAADSVTVRIPRVSYFASPAAACVDWFTDGSLVRSYVCPKISDYFRTATLEVDRFQGTAFPPEIDPDLDPSPAGLPAQVSIRETFLRSGIDLTVVHDDMLNDPDSPDVGDNWSEAELHDLMEDRFDSFADTLSWNLYGVIVPKFGDPNYNSGYYGTMFDWGGWQIGDSFLRQGWAVAEDATRGREVDDLYETSDKKDRLILQTMIHEAGHAFNLPHSWQRTINPDSGSESPMNYPWGYTDNGGGEENFWANFRWEFDDPELVWMRHADRNDVIFGGNDWIGNNLSADLKPAFEQVDAPVRFDVAGPSVFDIGVPVHLALQVENTSATPVQVIDRLQPEEGMLRVLIQRPSGDIVEFVPPVRRLMAPPVRAELAPGETLNASIGLSYGAHGHQFAQTGEYIITVYFPCFPLGFLAVASHRIRIAHPLTRGSEELAHLLTGKEAAQFLYFGGSARNADLTAELAEATDRFGESDPAAVRHIAGALARNAARTHKRIDVKRGRRVIVARDPDPDVAVAQIKAATEPLPDRYRAPSAFDAVSESKLVAEVADGLMVAGKKREATTVLNAATKRLKRAGGPASAVQRLESRLAKPKGKATRKKR
jgi:hypothetical protein